MKIERVPIPPAAYSQESIRDNLRLLTPGDSFALPAERRRALATAAWQTGKINGWTFTTRAMDDGTVRVWRVK
jgi:hypothetical protein